MAELTVPCFRTLQELIAPESIIFINVNWDVLGGFRKLRKPLADEEVCEYSRSLLTFAEAPPSFFDTQPGEIISAVAARTKIPKKYIATIGSHSGASVAQRMSWAAFREATKSEDTAYSLLGLFDINMPLLYGEMGVKAFRRLQKEIIAQSDDESIFVWKRATDHGQAVLASSPDDFVKAGSVIRTPGSRYKPYSITNKWLKITTNNYKCIARVIHNSKTVKSAYVIPLNCKIIEDPCEGTCPCFLVLQRDSTSGKYKRIAVNLHGHELARLADLTQINPHRAGATQQFYASIVDSH